MIASAPRVLAELPEDVEDAAELTAREKPS